jgi:hypothetical protein
MRKDKVKAIEEVKAVFLSTETNAEETALAAARCVTTMLEQRRFAQLSPDTGAEQLELIAEAALHAVRAHRCLSTAHVGLRDLPHTIVRGYGTSECPPNGAVGANVAPLRAVG